MAHEAEKTTGWSTSALADVARTSVKAIRHYHQAGLLPEPSRKSNGYKTYGREHLNRLLDILWMREAGFSVAHIGDWLSAETPPTLHTERLLAQVESSILRLTAVRADLLAAIERGDGSAPPVGTVSTAEADGLARRVMSRHFTPGAMAALRAIDSGDVSAVDQEFEQLPWDADPAVVEDLAIRMATEMRQTLAAHPLPVRVVEGEGSDQRRAALALGRVLAASYNPAQLDAVQRALGHAQTVGAEAMNTEVEV